MNIFTEIRNKITPSMRKKLDVPADYPRPQDDIPEERIAHRIVADYQRMYNERQALIDYIRTMEKLYKNAQVDLLKAVTKKNLKRNRLIGDVRLALYDMTSHHMTAQKMLRRNLGMLEEEETENNRQISDETIKSVTNKNN